MPRDYKSITAVVPIAARDNDLPANPQLAELVRAAPSGILHEHQAAQAVVFDGLAVDTGR